MAESHPGIVMTFKASGDLSSYQYHFVYLSAANTVSLCGANGKAIGILQNKPDAANESAEVMVTGVSKLVAGEEIDRGRFLTSKSDGHAEEVDAAGEFARAIAIEAAAADGDIITVLLCCLEATGSDA